jgi:hypothetical protein
MAKVCPTVFEGVQRRLRKHVATAWPECPGVSFRTRGTFLYVDVQFPDDKPPEPLCRLQYVGSASHWAWAFYSWSRGGRGGYEDSVLDSGSPLGTPEECFDCAASIFAA